MDMKRFEVSERFCRVLEYGELLFFSGHTAPGPDITAQAKALLRHLEGLLEKHGSGKDRILSAMVYLSDISLKAEFDRVWDAWVIEGSPPTRACVEAKLADPSLLVEIVLTAAKA